MYSDALWLRECDPDMPVEGLFIMARHKDTMAIPSMDEFLGCPHREHMPHHEFAFKFGTCDDDCLAVFNYCEQFGLRYHEHHNARRQLRVRGIVSQFNKAFKINISWYRRLGPDGKPYDYYDAEDPTFPESIRHHILHLSGLCSGHKLVTSSRARSAGMDIGSAALNFNNTPPGNGNRTPQEMMVAYQYPNFDAVNQTIGILMWTNTTANRVQDVQKTLTLWGVSAFPNWTRILVEGVEDSNAGGEETLDVTLAYAFSNFRAKIVTWVMAKQVPTFYENAMTRALHPNPGEPKCSVLSNSYGFFGAEEGNPGGLPGLDSYLVDGALQGITMIFSAGDWGAFGAPADTPIGGLPRNQAVAALYPASSPWSLSVGGTTPADFHGTGVNQTFQEWFWNDEYPHTQNQDGTWTGTNSAGGGGISRVFSRPAYQNGYTLPPRILGLSNGPSDGTGGRGYPDIAGNASEFAAYGNYENNTLFFYSGTSMTAPQYAGLIATINAGLGRNVGFINPSLYAIGSGIVPNATALRAVGSFVDAKNNTIAFTQPATNFVLTINGVADTTITPTFLLYYYITDQYWYQNAAFNWFTRTGVTGAWTTSNNPFPRMAMMRDIDGSAGVTTNSFKGSPGYTVTAGWDACTGLGVVNGQILFNYLRSKLPVYLYIVSRSASGAISEPSNVVGPFYQA